MAKKKKEACQYCGKQFVYLSRHKCKIKERLEGSEDDKTQVERRIERIEERKKETHRNLKKDEKMVLNLINREKDLFFEDLLRITGKNKHDLERILDVLYLQSKIEVQRELIDSSWTKHINSLEDYSSEIHLKGAKINKKKKDFIWILLSRQPCFVCPFVNKCSESNINNFNPHHCKWLTEWIDFSLQKKEYNINFDEVEDIEELN